MSAFENRLVFACNQVGEAAAETLEWINENEGIVGTERVSLLHEFNRTDVGARTLATAVTQPPAVAFVGSTRSGKTHTITSMIERRGGRLGMRFDGIREKIDYLRNIVPDSGRHGTSMVVRLSEQEKSLPQNFPIAMRLLSMADVIKILGNAYFTAAGKRARVPSLAEIRDLNTEARKLAGADPVVGLAEEDIWEVRTYFGTRFGDEPLFRTLCAAGFWQALAKLAPFISNAARGKLLAPLWGGLEPFEKAFVALADAVTSLGGGLDANCALDSILSLDPRTGRFSRRVDSVINGETISKLGTEDDRTVVVSNEFGHWISIPRIALAALAAEIRLPLPHESCEISRRADLLEFPGLDHRHGVANFEQALVKDPSLLGRIYLRAKAVYLHDYYSDQHKITSMVVCIDHAFRDVGELAPLVANWVEVSHGRDAVAREQHDNSLFLAFTKIDKEFGDSPRQGRDRRLDWTDRIRSILIEGFGRDHQWPHEWSPGRPFDNIHLLRNPSYKAKQILDYASDGQELGFKASQLDRIERSRREFMQSELVRRHFADPAGAWREAFVVNDGGLSYLAQSIAGVCDGRVKYRQIVASLDELREGMKDRLRRYYVSDNYSFQQDRRHTAGLLVVRRLKGCSDNRRFGHLLRSLQLSESEFADVLRNVEVWTGSNGEDGPHSANGLSNSVADIDSLLPVDATAAGDARLYARTAVDHWIETVRAIANGSAASNRYKLPRQALLHLVDELIVGATRMGLEHKVSELIERVTAGETLTPDDVGKAARCAASAIGDFIVSLGFDDVMANSHPRRKGKAQKPIFPPRSSISLDAADEADDLDSEFFADWSQAFISLVGDNATGLREREISDEQNRRLGRLLRLLEVTL
ncbi:MAG: virulence factor SrfC family protein [Hyphomicrobium sp.]